MDASVRRKSRLQHAVSLYGDTRKGFHTGRFNLAQGSVGAAMGVAASISTLATGFLFQGAGAGIGFSITAIVAGAATVLIWIFISETRPANYE